MAWAKLCRNLIIKNGTTNKFSIKSGLWVKIVCEMDLCFSSQLCASVSITGAVMTDVIRGYDGQIERLLQSTGSGWDMFVLIHGMMNHTKYSIWHKLCTGICCEIGCHFAISSSSIQITLQQSYDCLSVNEVITKDMDEIYLYKTTIKCKACV